jgi:hypothetical protein
MIGIYIIKLKKIVDALIEYVRDDYESKYPSREDETFLHQALHGTSDADYDFYVQAKEIFLRTSTSPRKIKTGLMFPRQVQGTPHIHVREPAKQNGPFNSLGNNFGGDLVIGADDALYTEYFDSKRSAFEIVITSDNPMESILVSEVIYSLLLAAKDTLTLNLFQTLTFSMRELIMNNDVQTPYLYVKSITMDGTYENRAMTISSVSDSLRSVIFNRLV